MDAKQSERSQIIFLQEQLQKAELAVVELTRKCKQKDQQIQDLQRQLAIQKDTQATHVQMKVDQGSAAISPYLGDSSRPLVSNDGIGLNSKLFRLNGESSAPITVNTVDKKRDAPKEMRRGAAAVDGNKCYFLAWGSYHIHEYDVAKNEWASVPAPYPYRACGLAVVNDLLTGVGGTDAKLESTNALCSLIGGSWEEGHFPPMPTARSEPAVVCGSGFLAAVGGRREVYLTCVEVMEIASLQWTSARSMPALMKNISAAVCGDRIYVSEGVGSQIYSCKYPEFFEKWERATDLFMKESTCSSLCGHLVVVHRHSAEIYTYDTHTNQWYAVGKLHVARSYPMVAPICHNKLLVVGGMDLDRTNNTLVTELVTGSVVL